MPLLTDIKARILALMAGTYPAVSDVMHRVIPAGTFTLGQIYLPQENPEFPAGADYAGIDRVYDVVATSLQYDGVDASAVNSANPYQGPHVRDFAFEIRIQYGINRPTPLAPRELELAMGALTDASFNGLSDLAVLEWCFLGPTAWGADGLGGSKIAMGWMRTGPSVTVKVDKLRMEARMPGRLLFSQSAVTSPGV